MAPVTCLTCFQQPGHLSATYGFTQSLWADRSAWRGSSVGLLVSAWGVFQHSCSYPAVLHRKEFVDILASALERAPPHPRSVVATPEPRLLRDAALGIARRPVPTQPCHTTPALLATSSAVLPCASFRLRISTFPV